MASFGRDTNIGYPDANNTTEITLLTSILAQLAAGITVTPVSLKGKTLDNLISTLEDSLTELSRIRLAQELITGQDIVDEETD